MAEFSNEAMIKRMKAIQEAHGISNRALSVSLGMSSGAMADWCKGLGRPSVAIIDKFSRMFRVSVGYLMYGDAGEKAVPQTASENELLSIYRSLPYDKRDMILSYAKGVRNAGLNNGIKES